MRTAQVLTGRGAISPLGLSAAAQATDDWPWRFANVDAVPQEDVTPYAARTIPASFAITDYVTAVGLRRKKRFSHLAIAAAVETHADSGFDEQTDKDRVGVVLGTEYGPQRVVAEYLDGLVEGGLAKARAGLFTQTVYNVATGQATMALGLRGPNSTVVGGSAIAYASRLVDVGKADAVLALSVDETNGIMDEHLLAVGQSLQGRLLPLTTGEAGAGVTVESAAAAERRGARPYAELLGVTQASAAGVTTSYLQWPHDDDTFTWAIGQVLDDAGLGIDDLSLVAGAGSGFPGPARAELAALRALGYGGPVLYPRVAAGECFGGNEALACVLALQEARPGDVVLVNVTTVNGGLTSILLRKAV